MPIMVQDQPCNPYYILTLLLLTSLDSRVNSCLESSVEPMNDASVYVVLSSSFSMHAERTLQHVSYYSVTLS